MSRGSNEAPKTDSKEHMTAVVDHALLFKSREHRKAAKEHHVPCWAVGVHIKRIGDG